MFSRLTRPLVNCASPLLFRACSSNFRVVIQVLAAVHRRAWRLIAKHATLLPNNTQTCFLFDCRGREAGIISEAFLQHGAKSGFAEMTNSGVNWNRNAADAWVILSKPGNNTCVWSRTFCW